VFAIALDGVKYPNNLEPVYSEKGIVIYKVEKCRQQQLDQILIMIGIEGFPPMTEPTAIFLLLFRRLFYLICIPIS